jgi:hypothetical protein
MKHLVILTALAFVASITVAGIVDTQDPPDIRLQTGAASPAGIVDLNDYFSTNNAGAATFSGGNAAANGQVTVPGAATPGTTDFTATISVGADSGSVSYTRKVSSFLLQGGPEADDSLILVDQAAGTNVFLNCLQAGAAVQSAAALTGGPAGGGTPGSGTPGDGTPGGGSAVWSITFGQVVSGFSTTGQKTRSSSVIASGGSSLSNGGLTASIDADGNYTLQADANFTGPVAVTFIKSAGDDMDSATVLASAAIVGAGGAGSNNLNDPNLAVSLGGSGAGGTLPAGASVQVGVALGASPAGFSDGTGIKVSAPAGETVQVFLPQVSVDGPVTVSVSAWALSGGAVGTTASLAALDSSAFLGEQNLTYMNANGSELGTLVPRRLSVVYDSPTGAILPVLQMIGPGTVEFDNLEVCRATAPDTYALGNGGQGLYGFPNVANAFAGDMSGGLTDVLINGVNAPDGSGYTASGTPSVVSANGFDTAGTPGSIALPGSEGVLTNINVIGEHVGTSAVRIVCNAQTASTSGDFGGLNFLALVVSALPDLGGSTASFGTFASASRLAGPGGWTMVETSGQIQSAALAPEFGSGYLITVQNASGNPTLGSGAVINVDDLAAYAVEDVPEYFDATLAGL